MELIALSLLCPLFVGLGLAPAPVLPPPAPLAPIVNNVVALVPHQAPPSNQIIPTNNALAVANIQVDNMFAMVPTLSQASRALPQGPRGRNRLREENESNPVFKPTVGKQTDQRAQATDQRRRVNRARSLSRVRFHVDQPSEDTKMEAAFEDIDRPPRDEGGRVETANASTGTNTIINNIQQMGNEVDALVAEYHRLQQEIHLGEARGATNIGVAMQQSHDEEDLSAYLDAEMDGPNSGMGEAKMPPSPPTLPSIPRK